MRRLRQDLAQSEAGLRHSEDDLSASRREVAELEKRCADLSKKKDAVIPELTMKHGQAAGNGEAVPSGGGATGQGLTASLKGKQREQGVSLGLQLTTAAPASTWSKAISPSYERSSRRTQPRSRPASSTAPSSVGNGSTLSKNG